MGSSALLAVARAASLRTASAVVVLVVLAVGPFDRLPAGLGVQARPTAAAAADGFSLDLRPTGPSATAAGPLPRRLQAELPIVASATADIDMTEAVSVARAAVAHDAVVRLRLFDDLVVAVRTRVLVTEVQTVQWTGSVEAGGREAGWWSLHATGDVVSADLVLSEVGRVVRLVTVSGSNRHLLLELAPTGGTPRPGGDTLSPPVDRASGTPMHDGQAPPSAAAAAGGPAVIDVMVVHTAGARRNAGSLALVRNDIGHAVVVANDVLARSGTGARLNLVGVFEVSGGDGLTGPRAAGHLVEPQDGVLDEVHALRRAVRADVVTLWADLSPYDGRCGTAFLMGPDLVSPKFAPYAFSVVDDDPGCHGSVAAYTHELGHLLGAEHDRDHADLAPAFPFGYGHRHTGPGQAFRTVMAYGAGCPGPCAVVPYFSSPRHHHDGMPVGQVSADNARVVARTAPVAATFAEHLFGHPFVGGTARPGGGFWTVTAGGKVRAHDGVPHMGDLSGVTLSAPVVGMVADPDGSGYWLVASDGGVFAFDAAFRGSTGGLALAAPVVGMVADPDGSGYWLVAEDGDILRFEA